MLGSSTTKFLGLIMSLSLLITGPVLGDTATESETSATEIVATQTTGDEDSSADQSGQTAVVVLTDPEIAATVDEEPDCE